MNLILRFTNSICILVTVQIILSIYMKGKLFKDLRLIPLHNFEISCKNISE